MTLGGIILKKKSIFSAALALSLGIGLWNVPNVTAPNVQAKEPAAHTLKQGGPVDLAIANEEKLIEMLKKDGKISANATPAEAEEAVRTYLKEKASDTVKEKGELYKQEAKREKMLQENYQKNRVLNGKGKNWDNQKIQPFLLCKRKRGTEENGSTGYWCC